MWRRKGEKETMGHVSVLVRVSAAEYCKKLKSERTQMQNEAEILKQEIESLNSAIK